MRFRGDIVVGMLVSGCLSWACSNSTAPPPPRPIPEASDDDVNDAGMVESDVLTPEGCMQGQSCDCVGLVSACMGGMAMSCFQPMDCEMSVTQADMLCVGADGGSSPGVCARRCAKDGGCVAMGMTVTCPSGYVCEQTPLGNPSYPVCLVPHALQAPDCNIDADCKAIPGSKCTAQGCVLACTN